LAHDARTWRAAVEKPILLCFLAWRAIRQPERKPRLTFANASGGRGL